jgi:iron complex outermembrane receptor protein
MKKTKLYAATALVGLSALNANAQTIDYELMEGIFGEKVTASATGKPQRASEAPVDMIIIGQDEIEKSGAQDIPQLLNKYAGMSVVRNSKNSVDVNVRGYNTAFSNKLLVLVNGRQVYQDAYGFTSWEFLPVQLSEIRQIEVVKGPNTSLFGVNAESGVINIITYSPLKDDINVLEAKYGSQNNQEGIAIATAKLADNFAARVAVETKSSDTFRFPDDADYDSDKGITKHTYNVDAEYQADASTNLRIQAGEVGGHQAETLAYLLTSNDSDKRFRYIQATLNKDTEIGLIKLNAYHNDSTADIGGFHYRNILDVFQAENVKLLDKDNTVRTGIEYRQSMIRGNGFGEGDFASKLLGISTMWDHRFNDKLTFTNSIRLDHLETDKDLDQVVGNMYSADKFDQNFDEISFNSGAVYKLSDLETLRFSAGRGVHLPSLIEMGGDSDKAIKFVGNPYLDPEVIWSAEVGYSKKLPEVQGNFKSTVFYQYFEDYISKTIPNPITLTAENAGDSESIGLELSYDQMLNENLQVGSSYTFMYTNDKQDGANMFNEDNNNEHKIAAWTQYTKDKLNAYAEAIWTSSVDYKSETNLAVADPVVEQKVDSYITLNANVSYDITEKSKVSLSGYNLLDEHNELPNGYNSAADYVYGGTELGRSVLVSYKYKF